MVIHDETPAAGQVAVSSRTTKMLRLSALALLLGGLIYAGTRPDIRAYVELDYLRRLTSRAGLLGIMTFLGLWVLSYLMQIPGLVFIVAALLGWGAVGGSLISFVGLTAATTASFWTIRIVGGSPASELEGSWIRKMLDSLDDRPIRTITLIRLVFLVNPVVNISLVLTDVRFRDYLLGSMLGFVLPLVVIACATETVTYYLVSA